MKSIQFTEREKWLFEFYEKELNEKSKQINNFELYSLLKTDKYLIGFKKISVKNTKTKWYNFI